MDPKPQFPLFSALPTELRIKIWEFALPGPRTVPVRYSRVAKQYISPLPPPALLHTNPESRAICLTQYTRLILSPKHPSSIFVSFPLDTIFFDTLDCSPEGDLAYDLVASPHSDRILRCAIDVQVWEVLRVFRFDSLSEVRLMPNLQAIALVMPKESSGGAEERGEGEGEDADGRGLERERGALVREFSDSLWYVENLRQTLESGVRKHWGDGMPSVQLWFSR